MNLYKTKAVVLSRTNYRETDRIISVLTPDYGKLHLIAKGVRTLKSKLAGGIELFSISDIVFIRGRGELATLTSARLEKHFDQILNDLNKVRAGYEILKIINRVTEDEAEAAYFELLCAALEGLNDIHLPEEVNRLWFSCHLLRVTGYAPSLAVDSAGKAFSEEGSYNFDGDNMTFVRQDQGRYSPNHIKYLKLVFRAKNPSVLAKVVGGDGLAGELLLPINLIQNYLH